MLEGPWEPVRAMSNASAAAKKPNLVRLDQQMWGGGLPPAPGEAQHQGFIFRDNGDWFGSERYAIVELLGKGGMCEVWLAYDRAAPDDDPRRFVAIKVLQSKLEIDDKSRRRLKAEALAFMAIPDDPNLPRVYAADIDPERNLFYYVMEYLRGETLEERVRARGPLPLTTAAHIVASVSEAVQVLHAMGILHRDLKPENIFLTDEGRVVLLDLGVAKFDEERFPARSTFRTDDASIAGTFAYMSPEQCLGEKLDVRSDVYALGLIAYGCLAGHHAAQEGPGGWIPNGYRAWSGWHLNNKPAPLTLTAPGLPARVWPVIAKALEKDRAQRWATAADLAVELRTLETFARELDDVAGPLPSLPPGVSLPELRAMEVRGEVRTPEREVLTARGAESAETLAGPPEMPPPAPPPVEALLSTATTEEAPAEKAPELVPPREETVSMPNMPEAPRVSVAGASERPRVTRTGTVILPRGTGEAEAAARTRMRTAQGTEILPNSKGSQRPPASGGGLAEHGPAVQATQAEVPSEVGPGGTARLGKEGGAISMAPAAGTLARGLRRAARDPGGSKGGVSLIGIALAVLIGVALGSLVLLIVRSWHSGAAHATNEANATPPNAMSTTNPTGATTTTNMPGVTTNTSEMPLAPAPTMSATGTAPPSAEPAPSVTPPAATPKKMAPPPAKTPRPVAKPSATGKPAAPMQPLFDFPPVEKKH